MPNFSKYSQGEIVILYIYNNIFYIENNILLTILSISACVDKKQRDRNKKIGKQTSEMLQDIVSLNNSQVLIYGVYSKL